MKKWDEKVHYLREWKKDEGSAGNEERCKNKRVVGVWGGLTRQIQQSNQLVFPLWQTHQAVHLQYSRKQLSIFFYNC